MTQFASAIARPKLATDSLPAVACGWLKLLCLILAGYAWFGKGFAYLGVPPLYVGELTLACGIVWLLLFGTPRIDSPIVWLLVAMCVWGSLCTFPYLSIYGIDALRDAAIFGYCAFAILVYSYLLDDPRRLPWLLNQFRRFSILFIWTMPVIWIVFHQFNNSIARWPWSGTPIVSCKGGDILVHYSGILAFWVTGLARTKLSIWHCIPIGVAVVLIAADSRGGLLTFLLVFAICLFWQPINQALWKLILLGCFGIAILMATNARFEVTENEGRVASAEQLITNLWSMLSETDTGDLEGTKQWRLEWWTKIVNYTVYGPHFIAGKGFGINLADDDGFKGTVYEGLRSPHNGHLTMLARAGVPGFVIWVAVHLCWFWVMIREFFQSRRGGETVWEGLFMFLLLYWLALMVNASFDVYIEGPMGGVWLWTIYGVGLGAAWIHRYRPEILSNEDLAS